MEAVLIIFMVLASIIGIGSTVIVTMTVVRESKERKAAAKADCDHCEKIPDCDSCDKVANCDECDKIPDCDHCDKIPDCDSCDKVVNCDECEYKKVVEEAVKAYVGKEKAYACAETTATERCVAEDVATEPDAEEAEVVKATESPEGNVAFSATRETIDERYLALPGEYKIITMRLLSMRQASRRASVTRTLVTKSTRSVKQPCQNAYQERTCGLRIRYT